VVAYSPFSYFEKENTMKRITLSIVSLFLASLVFAPINEASAATKFPRNLRVVIGSKSTGGDTYQNSAIVAEVLAEKLGINVKVDAVGSTAAFKTIERVSNGSVIMIFHDQAYLGLPVWSERLCEPFLKLHSRSDRCHKSGQCLSRCQEFAAQERRRVDESMRGRH
jgi:ABC-type glycerol-3-phosphate transport system substrate-binding protein